jgi:hypothetical protein
MVSRRQQMAEPRFVAMEFSPRERRDESLYLKEE